MCRQLTFNIKVFKNICDNSVTIIVVLECGLNRLFIQLHFCVLKVWLKIIFYLWDFHRQGWLLYLSEERWLRPEPSSAGSSRRSSRKRRTWTESLRPQSLYGSALSLQMWNSPAQLHFDDPHLPQTPMGKTSKPKHDSVSICKIFPCDCNQLVGN